mmetsp:Transcript_4372/g.12043  ORF Transcript_4372/g.12043 Transcript_4372/m.12043 type:complete len:133 (+) Transcript_4372:1503-1901(+)
MASPSFSSSIKITVLSDCNAETAVHDEMNNEEEDKDTKEQVESLQTLLKEAEEEFAKSRSWFAPILQQEAEQDTHDNGGDNGDKKELYQESVMKGIAAIHKSTQLLETISQRQREKMPPLDHTQTQSETDQH